MKGSKALPSFSSFSYSSLTSSTPIEAKSAVGVEKLIIGINFIMLIVLGLCVRPSRFLMHALSHESVYARVLKFHIWFPHGKIAYLSVFVFLVRVISLSGVMLLKNQHETCQQGTSKSI